MKRRLKRSLTKTRKK